MCDETALRTIAPIDDGHNATDTARQLLLAATQLPDVRLVSHCRGGRFDWCGRLAEAALGAGTVRLRGQNLSAEVELGAVLAVSHCARGASSGICLYDESGAFMTLWSAHGEAFDAWLGETVAGYACRVDRTHPTRLLLGARHRRPARNARTSRAP